MEKHEILSMKNCHRAATVQQIGKPRIWGLEIRVARPEVRRKRFLYGICAYRIKTLFRKRHRHF